jgi:hypothetical protein
MAWKMFISLSVPALMQASRWKQGEKAVARVAEVLDYLLGFSVTLGAVVVLEGRQCAPGDMLG